MKKYLVASLILHSTILLLNFTNPEKKKTTLVEFSVAQKSEKKEEQKKQNPTSVKVIELAGEGNKKKDLRSFYWGLGFSSSQYETDIDHVPYYVIDVTETYGGYNGQEDGLLPFDKIYLVNGERISGVNDIRGDGPADLILTILRGNAKIIIHTKRCKVYY